MGVVSIVGKLVLVIVNMALLLLSLAMIAIGVILIAGKDIYNDLLDKWQTELEGSVNDLGASVDTNDLSMSEFLIPVAYALIVIGFVTGALALLGCIGGCYAFKIILIVYVIATAAIFLVQVIIVAAVYADKSTFDSTIKPYIKDTLKDYAGIEGSDANSLAWNALMNYEKCCGVDDYKDFTDLDNWPPATIGGNAVSGLLTPVICCVSKTNDYACAKATLDSSTNYYQTGCYDKFFDLIMDNAMVVTVIILILAAQFVLIFFTIWILCTMDNKIDII